MCRKLNSSLGIYHLNMHFCASLERDSVVFHARHKRAIKYHTVRTFCVAFVWHLIKMHFFLSSLHFFLLAGP